MESGLISQGAYFESTIVWASPWNTKESAPASCSLTGYRNARVRAKIERRRAKVTSLGNGLIREFLRFGLGGARRPATARLHIPSAVTVAPPRTTEGPVYRSMLATVEDRGIVCPSRLLPTGGTIL